MLHCRFVRSEHPHARLLNIDVSKARTAPGVCAVLTAADIAPERLLIGTLTEDTPVLAGRSCPLCRRADRRDRGRERRRGRRCLPARGRGVRAARTDTDAGGGAGSGRYPARPGRQRHRRSPPSGRRRRGRVRRGRHRIGEHLHDGARRSLFPRAAGGPGLRRSRRRADGAGLHAIPSLPPPAGRTRHRARDGSGPRRPDRRRGRLRRQDGQHRRVRHQPAGAGDRQAGEDDLHAR